MAVKVDDQKEKERQRMLASAMSYAAEHPDCEICREKVGVKKLWLCVGWPADPEWRLCDKCCTFIENQYKERLEKYGIPYWASKRPFLESQTMVYVPHPRLDSEDEAQPLEALSSDAEATSYHDPKEEEHRDSWVWIIAQFLKDKEGIVTKVKAIEHIQDPLFHSYGARCSYCKKDYILFKFKDVASKRCQFMCRDCGASISNNIMANLPLDLLSAFARFCRAPANVQGSQTSR